MEQVTAIGKAIGDPTRLRALMLLVEGELCLCQIIDVLGLSPSTVSKHMSILHAAGLIERRKEGRWHYYRLAGRGASPVVRSALRWITRHVEPERTLIADTKKLCCTRKKTPKQLAACYTKA